MNMKILITGVLGQDGLTMVEYLLKNTNAKIFGLIHKKINNKFINLKNNPRFEFIYGDLTDSISINEAVKNIQPDYFINFGGQSFIGSNCEMPFETFDINTMGVLRCLEAIRRYQPKCRFCSAGSSEEFGDIKYIPQNLDHPINPKNLYGLSKATAHHLVKLYRELYNLYAVHCILYNHESENRNEKFVTRKITKGVAGIVKAIKEHKPFKPIELGNLNAKRDWSYSQDFIEGIWKTLNQESPKEYIFSSNEAHTVREFVEKAFTSANIVDFHWKDNEINEKLVLNNYILEENDIKSSILVTINPKFYRPLDTNILLGDSNETRKELNWEPKVKFDELVRKMVKHDLNEV